MPDKDGILTNVEKEQIETWLKEHWKNWACPFSADTTWKLGDFLVHTAKFAPEGGWVIGGPSMPSAVVVCAGCGYQVFINAVMVGLVPPLESPAKEGSDV